MRPALLCTSPENRWVCSATLSRVCFLQDAWHLLKLRDPADAASGCLNAFCLQELCEMHSLSQAGRPHATSAEVHDLVRSFWLECIALTLADWCGLCRWPCLDEHSSQHHMGACCNVSRLYGYSAHLSGIACAGGNVTVLLFGKPIGHGVYHPGREVVQKSRRHLLQLDLLSTLFNIPVVIPPTTPPGLQVKTLHLPHIPRIPSHTFQMPVAIQYHA